MHVFTDKDGCINRKTVLIEDLIKDTKFKESKYMIPLALGRLLDESPVYIDLQKMPHILIAGRTGTGKSCLLNAFIISILNKLKSDEYKLTLIDTKDCEFTSWNDFANVITNCDDAILALVSIHNEMDRRYMTGKLDKLPYQIIIIDEMVDLMAVYSDRVTKLINSILQKGRGVGIHLIDVTRQQGDIPDSVLDLFPVKIAFSMRSADESKRFIDVPDADDLHSYGEALFSDMGREPIKIFTPWVWSGDIENALNSL